ncbi:hypothetical protein BDB01DRAFT_714376 [Pilobolus umbonatus]|nr:hypothetical protein BDB01DRAFT_714376 [Pilobolus umbonatus]
MDVLEEPSDYVARDPTQVPIDRDDRGGMVVECPYCRSLMYLGERSVRSCIRSPVFQMCCKKGKAVIPPMPSTPYSLSELLTENDCISREFRKHIRSYNSSLSFTSLGVNLD